MKKRSLLSNSAVVAIAFMCAPVHATVIDFTNSAPWSAANGLASYTNSGVTLSSSATLLGFPTPTQLTFNAGACGNTSVGLACAGQGIGINRTIVTSALLDQNDEIDFAEILRVGFSTPSDIIRLEFLKVFAGLLPEAMQVRVNGAGPWISLSPSTSAAGGYFDSGFSAFGVSTLDIRAAGILSNNPASDGSLARITIPVPASAALLGLGLLGIAALRKRIV